MKTFGTEFKVGLFTILAIAAIGYMFFVLNPGMFKREETHTYYTILQDAANIIERTHVKTNGVTIGKVTEVRLETNQTRITMEVDASVRIPVGSTVEVRTTGLLGDSHIEIVREKDTGEYIENGGYIPVSADKVGINQVISIVGAIVKDVKQITSSMAEVLGGEEGKGRVEDIAQNLQQFTENLNAVVAENRRDVRTIVEQLTKASDAIENVVAGNEQRFHEVMANVRESSEALKEFSNSVRDVVDDENRERIETILAKFEASMEDIKQTSGNVRLVAEKIERGEGTIGRLLSDDETIDTIQATLEDIRAVVAPARKLQVGVDMRADVYKDGGTQQFFKVRMQTRPDRFYLLGFTDYKRNIKETRTQVFPTEPGDQPGDPEKIVERETITVDQGLKFDFQFGKRWGHLALRLGLFESTGGFAADFYLWRDRFRLTGEAYDFGSKRNGDGRIGRLRAYASILFYNHIYMLIGAETDGTDDGAMPFAGAGIQFTDEDLKTVLGAAALAL